MPEKFYEIDPSNRRNNKKIMNGTFPYRGYSQSFLRPFLLLLLIKNLTIFLRVDARTLVSDRKIVLRRFQGASPLGTTIFSFMTLCTAIKT
jgi:hypothetical protein